MDVLGFALAVLLIELTPGPNMAWLAGLAATEGRRSGMAAVAGVALGLLVNGALAGAGLAALLTAVPMLWHALRLAGAAMIGGIAVATWITSGTSLGAPAPSRYSGRSFLAGLLINLLNPKAYMFFMLVVPQFMKGRALHLAEAMVLSVISASIATAIHVVIVLGGSSAQAWLADPARTRVARRAFALVILAMAVSFLFIDQP